MTQLRINVGVLRRAAAHRAAPVVEAIAIKARDEVVETMENASPSGLTYKVPGTNTTYVASAPGEPPAIREGLYAGSIKYTPAVDDGERIRARAYTDRRVGPGEKYLLGELLENGTETMEPRPHWRPAFDSVQDEARRIVREANGG